MFREILIESSSQAKKRRRWPMATAFVLQVIAAALLIVVPMLSTGVIPLSARTVVFTPTTYQPRDVPRPTSDRFVARSSAAPSAPHFVPIYNNGPNVIRYGPQGTDVIDHSAPPDPWINIGGGGDCSACFERGNQNTVPPKPPDPPKRVPVSELSEALLINKVVPAYPIAAQRSGVQGDVKLHAIIGRDGSIESLTLISGSPLLAPAAISAVQQWKYRPYILNGQKVEVETWITVSFKRNM